MSMNTRTEEEATTSSYGLEDDDRRKRQRVAVEHALDDVAAAIHAGLVVEADRLARLRIASATIAAASGETKGNWVDRVSRQWGNREDVQAAADLAFGSPVDTEVLELVRQLAFPQPDPLSRDPRTDIPSLVPRIAVPVWAGISDVDLAINLAGPDTRVTSASVDIAVQLPAGNRGAHMSRFQQAVLDSELIQFDGPVEAASWLAGVIAAEQPALAGRATVRMKAKQLRLTAQTQRLSAIMVGLVGEVVSPADGRMQGSISVEVDVMTACPCTLRFSELKAERVLGGPVPDLPPTFTHSQPGALTVVLSGPVDALPQWQEVVDALEGVAHFREAVLKRPDEHELVERAHRGPQFTEDLTRLALAAVAARVPGHLMVRVSARLFESIHPHTAVSSIEASAASVWSD